MPAQQLGRGVKPASAGRPLLHGAEALDLACGTGKNTLFLAEHGHHVTAVDWSGAALDILEARAGQNGIPVQRFHKMEEVKLSRQPGVDLLQADLEKIRLPVNRYHLVVCIRYLQRTLFPQIERALCTGGMLLVETYTQAQLDFPGGPRNPGYLLQVGELRTAFPGLTVLFYRELRAGQGIASLLARKSGDGIHNRGQNGN